MQEICAEAGISPGALYRYFSSKADIIAAIAEDERRESDAALDEVRTQGALVEALCAMAQRMMGNFAQEAAAPIFADVFAEAARDPQLAARLGEIDAKGLQRLTDALIAAQARHEIDGALEPDSAARTLIALIEGLAMRNALAHEHTTHCALKDFRALATRYLAVRS